MPFCMRSCKDFSDINTSAHEASETQGPGNPQQPSWRSCHGWSVSANGWSPEEGSQDMVRQVYAALDEPAWRPVYRLGDTKPKNTNAGTCPADGSKHLTPVASAASTVQAPLWASDRAVVLERVRGSKPNLPNTRYTCSSGRRCFELRFLQKKHGCPWDR